MADVKMPESIPCQFDAGGWSPCKKPSDNGWCSEHEGLACGSCAKQAVTECDAQIGGVQCGIPLCSDCVHGPEGNHITEGTYNEILKRVHEEREARVASRTNPIQRMNEKFGVPATLSELLKSDPIKAGFELQYVYYLEIKHGLMGFFPAILSSDKRIIFTTDLRLLERVWKILDPRRATVRMEMAYVNRELGLFYIERNRPEEREDEEPSKLLTTTEFDKLVGSNEAPPPFIWTSGLWGGGSPDEEEFVEDLTKQAVRLDPNFTSSLV